MPRGANVNTDCIKLSELQTKYLLLQSALQITLIWTVKEQETKGI